jgi:hypothetical protein
MYTRNIDPSYVTATCDHADVDNADPAGAATSDAPTCTYPDGLSPPPDEYNPYDNPPDASFNTTVRHPANVDGRTHADTVIPDDNRNPTASGTDTKLDDPLNDNAFPYRPAVDHDAPLTDPTCPFPDRSPTTNPAPSSKLYEATNPDVPPDANVAV